MILSQEDAQLFHKLHKALMIYVNQKLKIVKRNPPSHGRFQAFPLEERLKLRNALHKHRELIDDFVGENPFGFDEEELEIIRSWRHLVAGKFVVFRYLKKHTIFLTMEEPTVAYGVVALSDPFEEALTQDLPIMGETDLLPFKGRIVYDGMMSLYNIAFGGGYRRSFKESYDRAKAQFGVVTSLPMEPGKAKANTPKSATRSSKKERSKPKRKAVRKKAGSSEDAQSPLVGRWRITWMEMWDQSFVDAEVEGYIRFDDDGSGEFQFGYVHGNLNYQESEHDDKPAVVFTFEGNDEMDPCSGRGWSIRKGNQILGKIVFHRGDDSKFKATR